MVVLSLEERLRRIENRVTLLVNATDCEKHPFICACIDADMDIGQVDTVLELVSKTANSIGTANPVSYAQFEAELKIIVPSRKNDAQFAKTIIRALNRENKFLLGANRFREEGIEI